ncbi:MAG: FeoC-like transcriptional regulator [Anaerolineae bacterium]|nr:FeoC-like transcriptional regulator [Anaerolineae bacterium]
MLRDVLRAVESTQGSITLVELSRRLNIDPGVLEGMLQHWERKGRLVLNSGTATACNLNCATECACSAVAAGACCPFVVRLPRSYSAANRSDEV